MGPGMPTNNWCYSRDFDRKKFAEWLAAQPVIIEPNCGDYEIARYRYGRDRFIIWEKPSKGRITFTGDIGHQHYLSFAQGGILARPVIDPIAQPGQIKRDFFKIYSDASQKHSTSTGAWGAVLVMPDDRTLEVSGALKGDILSSTSAEMAAVANALHSLIAKRAIPPGSAVEIICDNAAVVRYIQRGKCSAKGISAHQTIPAYEYFAGLAKRAGLKISGKWVRAHQKENKANQDITMNRRADKLAGVHSDALHRQRIAAQRTEPSTEGEISCCQ